MKVFRTDHFPLPLPEGHGFPLRKYRLLWERLEQSGLIAADDAIVPHAATEEELLLVHSAEYLDRLKRGLLTPEEQRRIGLPWSPELVERARRSTGATIEACRTALDEGIAVNLAGGTHHAFRDRGEGYCLFNDAVVAARVMQAEGRVRRIVFLDCDAHQGNGTAALARGDASLYTFSLHAATAFPRIKEPSDLDIELPRGADDVLYLGLLEHGLRRALAESEADLAIYLAGADPYFDDRLGHLGLTAEGLAERDEMVLEACAKRRLPVAVTMAGGYARRVEDVADLYFQTVRIAAEHHRRRSAEVRRVVP